MPSRLKGRLKSLEKKIDPHRRGCLIILNSDGSIPALPVGADKSRIFVILPAKKENQNG